MLPKAQQLLDKLKESHPDIVSQMTFGEKLVLMPRVKSVAESSTDENGFRKT